MLLARRFAQLTVLCLSVVLLAESRCPAADAEGKAEKQKAGPKIRVIQPGRIQAAPGARVFQGGFRGGFAGGLNTSYLLRRPEVQKELNITDEQKTKIEAITAEQREASRGIFGGANLRDLTQEERQKKMTEFREKSEKLNAEMQKKIDAVLNDEQRKRLKGIGIQQRGVYALSDAGVAKDLGLSSSQQEKIRAAYASQQEKSRAMSQDRRDGKIDRAKMSEKYSELRKETEAAVLGVLTDAQKKKFEEMKGKKFELPRRQFRGGQPRGIPRKPRPGDEV